MKKYPVIILFLATLPATFYFSAWWPWFINTFFPLATGFMDKYSNTLEGIAATFAIISSIVGGIFWKKHRTPPIDTDKVKTNTSDSNLPQDSHYKPTTKTIDTSIVLDEKSPPFLGLSAFQQAMSVSFLDDSGKSRRL